MLTTGASGYRGRFCASTVCLPACPSAALLGDAPEGTAIIRPGDIPLSAVDFHVSGVVEDVLAKVS
jgi:hypothetical protein